MAINLVGLPSNWRAPGTYIANAPQSGGATVGLLPTLMLGQMTSTGTASPNVPIAVFSFADVKTLFGAESMLASMYLAWRANDPQGTLWVCPLQDDAAATAASRTVTITGTATAAGTITCYVNNIAVNAAVSVGDTATVAATALATAITAKAADPNTVLGATAAPVAGVVTVTAANKGITAGDGVQCIVNKNGAANGEYVPAGLAVAVSAITAGTTDPDLTTAIANITPLAWSFLVCPYTTVTANTAIAALLSDTVGRWAPVQQMYGVSFGAVRGTLSAITTYGASVGANKHMTVLGIMDSQTPTFVAAGIFAGLAGMVSRSNPALPIVGVLEGLDAPSVTQRLRRVDENTLLYSGISPVRVDMSGNATLSRACQTYQTDTNYLNIETDFLVEYTDIFIRSDLENVYAQKSLLADGNPVAAGSGATTPALILAHVWGLYLTLEDMGIVQGSKQFIAGSYAEADIPAGVVSLYLPVVTAGQLRVIRIQNSFS